MALIWTGSSGALKTQNPWSSLQALLPGPAELAGWTRDGESQGFAGEGLFNYINGGAEVYFEYGFRWVAVQDYRTDAGNRLSLEVFEMDDPESAYGIYTFKTSRNGEPIPLGDNCQLADYYLNLHKGPYLVTITGLEVADGDRKAILLLARAIAPKLGPRTAAPNLISRLPTDGLKTQTIKYFKGPLALYNSYPFFRTDVFAFSAGIKGEYTKGYELYIFEYPDDPSAHLGFAEAAKNFEQSEKYKNFSAERGIYKLDDDRDNRLFVTTKGRYLLLWVGGDDEDSARKIFDGVMKEFSIS